MEENSKTISGLRSAVYALLVGVSLWLSAIGCDHGLEATPPGPTGISGRVTFVGIWTDEVEQVAVAVYREVPQKPADFFALIGADTEVELGGRSYDYFVPIEGDGVYQWIVVAWRRKDSFWDFSSLLGCHYLPGESLPGQVAVRRGQVTRDIDIVVDLGILQGETIPGMDICERVLPAELLAVRDQGG